MDERAPVSNQTRILFALVGAIACLAAACLAELALGKMNAGALLRKYHAASILFLTGPATTFTAEEPPSAPPPPSDNELQRRLDRVGAQSGDVQISLTWNNRNDLDLSCVDPYGEMIDGYNQSSRSGGVIDVDMNVTPGDLLSPQAERLVSRRFGNMRAHRTGISSEPVENLIWASNAPSGHYKVFVHQFCNKEQTASTPYWVVVRVHGQVHRITGVMGREDFCQQLVEPKPVFEFDVEPPKPAAPVVEAKEPPAPKPFQPPPPPRMVRHVAYSLNHLDYALLTALLWGTLAGVLPIALVIAQRLYLKLPALYGEPDLIVGFGGPATGFAAALIAQTVLSLLASLFAPPALPALFVFSWMLLGALFAGVLSFYTPNVPRIAAFVAGTLSALIGSSLFLTLAANHQDTAGRLLCASIIGGTIGALIALPKREREPEPEPEPRPRATYEVQPPFLVRGTRTRKVGGLRRTDDQ